MEFAKEIKINTYTGEIFINGVAFGYYIHDDGPEVHYRHIENLKPLVSIPVFTDRIVFVGKNGEDEEVYEFPEKEKFSDNK